MKKSDLVATLKKLREWADDLHDGARKVDDEEAAVARFLRDSEKRTDLPAAPASAAIFAALRGSAPALPGAAGPSGQADAGSTQTGFDTFLRTMAEAVVSAQKRLDKESELYLAEIAGRPEIQPTVFRMPRLEAEMKFDLQVENGKALNLLFWGANSRERQTNQQGISFELVSVPAPPGAMEAARRAVPLWRQVQDPVVRRELLEKISAMAATSPKSPVVNAAGSRPDDVALIDLGDEKRYLVLYAEDVNEKDVGIWLLTAPPDTGATLEEVYRFNKSNGPGEVRMRDLVLELARRQQQLSGK
jgi:hypothetical protein